MPENKIMEKPLLILQLEKEYKIEITEVFSINEFTDYENEKNNYYLLQENKIIGLKLEHISNWNFDSIIDFQDLKYLKLQKNFITKIEGIAHLADLDYLDLSSNSITKIEGLDNLHNLKKLQLDENNISRIEGLENLKNIENLNISRCIISKIEGLDNLKKLETLHLYMNQISKIEGLKKLVNLRKLSFWNNKISKIEGLDNLTNIRNLDLSENEISKIENLEHLKNLEELQLNENRISKIEGLQNLINLQHLDLVSNKLPKIEGLNNLSNLKSLDLWNNEITKIEGLDNLSELESLDLYGNLIHRIENLDILVNLESLDLGNNNISNIEGLNTLKKLKKINLIANMITDIRYILERYVTKFDFYVMKEYYEENEGIFLQDNPLGEDLEARLEIEDLEERKKSLLDYYENIKLGAEPFREAKLMLLGEGGAGKTNFSNYIMGIPFEKGKSATTGIKIDHWKPIINENNYRINIWDFGGQWIQQQVHQFFLTSECLYVIVLNARNLEKPYKWLDWIKNYGSNSRTIIVVNQMEENANRYLEENNLKAEYPFIKNFHYISLLKTSENDAREKLNMNDLMHDIKNQLMSLKNIHALHPINYHKLKSDLEDNFLDKNHSLPFKDFEESLIDKHSIKGNSEILLKVLQTMGTLRYFENHDRLILSPEWLSDGVYKIMMSDLANSKFGVLEEIDIVQIMKESVTQYAYKTSDIYFLRQLMQDFELAYIDENKNYFIPAQFKTDIPDDFDIQELREDASLEFVFEFDTYFPEILISKLIVFFFRKVQDEVYWKTGIYLEDNDADIEKSVSALVQSLEKERRIRIFMFGDDVRNFFKEIRNKILDYLKNTNYKYTEFIIPENLETKINYRELITLYKKGIPNKQIVYKEDVINLEVTKMLGMINNDKELEALKKENEELKKREKSSATNTIIINGNDAIIQTGKKSKQVNNKNTSNIQLESAKQDIQSFIDELDDLKIRNQYQDNINGIFIELLDELSALDVEDLNSEPEKAKTFLEKLYDNGKRLNDWKNITILPYEIIDKGAKIIESLNLS